MKPIEHVVGLAESQIDCLRAFEEMARAFNQRLNLYSEASAKHFWTRHVQHSLAIATRPFAQGCRVVDWGTGGGLPGIPLAVAFPEVEFVLVDSVGKKTKAVATMARRLGLANVDVWHGRAERWGGKAHYGVSRATAPLKDLWNWTSPVLQPIEAPTEGWKGGLICLKGEVVKAEVVEINEFNNISYSKVHELASLLDASQLQEKVLVEVIWAGSRGNGAARNRTAP